MPVWAAVNEIHLPLQAGQTPLAQQLFRVPQSAGSWQVDYVYVDPCRAD
jgi:hypothetical protein